MQTSRNVIFLAEVFHIQFLVIYFSLDYFAVSFCYVVFGKNQDYLIIKHLKVCITVICVDSRHFKLFKGISLIENSELPLIVHVFKIWNNFFVTLSKNM